MPTRQASHQARDDEQQAAGHFQHAEQAPRERRHRGHGGEGLGRGDLVGAARDEEQGQHDLDDPQQGVHQRLPATGTWVALATMTDGTGENVTEPTQTSLARQFETHAMHARWRIACSAR
ncbi:MAG: hypothetical protein U0P30_14455 [Vicinamibacterales bacterium]